MTFLPFHRQLFLLSFIFITVTFLFESQKFTFSAGSLKISSETHPLFIICAGLAFLQGIFIWFLRVKKNISFPEQIGYFHFFASFISLFGLDFLAKRIPSTLFLTAEEAKWLPFFNGGIWFVCFLYISSLILFLSTSFILLTKKEEQSS
ncbi:MAG: hypothetical protein NWT07_15060 [Saprospiraceae bacterium]|nr:hypothetical protein [Saprospiraceae bacterium]MDP4915137.1 hypothetical protein [Saprospiraceae bacterium]